jgi:hypothetical protein
VVKTPYGAQVIVYLFTPTRQVQPSSADFHETHKSLTALCTHVVAAFGSKSRINVVSADRN